VRGLAPEASMTRKTHTLMVVHAHPDDEASSTGVVSLQPADNSTDPRIE